MMVYLVAGICLVVYLGIAWLLGSLLRLHGTDLAFFRTALSLMGVAAAAAVVYFLQKRKPAAETAAPAADGGAAEAIDFLIREANTRLAASARVAGARRVGDLPLWVFLGAAGSTKTTVIVHSGLEPELLAGEVFRDNAIAPTAAANLWFAGGSVLVEAGGKLATDAAAWKRLVQRLGGRGWTRWLGRRAQAPRRAVVCFNCEAFAQPGAAADAAAAGRNLRLLLAEAAHQWGSRLPVYVLFTRLDRLPYFTDFVRNLGKEEAAQAFGATLPMAAAQAGGVWAEQETRRLGAAFDELFFGLAEKRADYLRRENDAARLPNVYEFPREFRKLREHVIRFLLELSRPSQLRAMPFLRGFYFTGVRPIETEEAAPVAAALVRERPPAASEATMLFRGAPPAGARPAAGGVGTARRVPQWVFLSHFFSDVLLQDRSATAASGSRTSANLTRRILLASAAALLLLFLCGATVSYVKNRALLARLAAPLAPLSRLSPAAAPAVPSEALRQLEDLRAPTAEVTGYDRDGAPLSLRWGLYPGHDLAEAGRTAWCAQFKRFLLADTLAGIQNRLRALPPAPGPGDSYETSYASLKAYLMATSQPAKTDPAFLTRVLADRWAAGRDLSPELAGLPRNQFEFYSQERASGFCPAAEDPDAVANARAHLLGFQLVDRAYQNMLTEVSRQFPAVRFADPTGAVVNRREVEGAYTRAGWSAMQAAIAKAPDYLNREPWVLGQNASAGNFNAAEIVQQLRQRYTADYAGRWQQFLGGGGVTRYASLKDGALKLKSLSDPQSPLLRMFCLVSQNTAVEAPDIARAFQPIQALEAPATCGANLNSPSTGDYMRALAALQVGVDRLAGTPDASGDLPEAAQATVSARTTEQALNLPPDGQRLLEAPIVYAQDLARSKLPAQLDGKGRSFCAALEPLLRAAPFNANTSQGASLDAFNGIFQPPAGRLWAFYNETLQTYLPARGSEYLPAPDSKVTVSDNFVRFFNKAANISRAFYPAGAARPNLVYALRAEPSPDLDSFTLQIDGATLRGSRKGGETQQFSWPGDGSGVTLAVRARGRDAALKTVRGPWALFQFVALANRDSQQGAGTLLEWDLVDTSTLGRATAEPGEKIATLRLYADPKGAPNILRRGYLASLGCVSKITR